MARARAGADLAPWTASRAAASRAATPSRLSGRDPDPGGLESLLGPQRLLSLRRLLLARAIDWASELAPGAVHVAYEPSDAGAAVRGLVGPDVNLFPQNGAGLAGRLANASVLALAGGDGPLLIAWPELMHWRPEHADGGADRSR